MQSPAFPSTNRLAPRYAISSIPPFLTTNKKISSISKFDYCMEETSPIVKFVSDILRETVTSGT